MRWRWREVKGMEESERSKERIERGDKKYND
jgi:hypothetical protein